MAPQVLGTDSIRGTTPEVAKPLALDSMDAALPHAFAGAEMTARKPSKTRASEPPNQLLSDDSASVSANTTSLESKAQQVLATGFELPHSSHGSDPAGVVPERKPLNAATDTRTHTVVPKAEAPDESSEAVDAQSMLQSEALNIHPRRRHVNSDSLARNHPSIKRRQTAATTEPETLLVAPRHGRIAIAESPKRVASTSPAATKISPADPSPADPSAAWPPSPIASKEETRRLNDESTASSTNGPNEQSFAHPMATQPKDRVRVRGVVQAHPVTMPRVALSFMTLQQRGKPEKNPTVQVRIGRVDVRTVPSPQGSPPTAQKIRRQSGFDDYFALRSYNRTL